MTSDERIKDAEDRSNFKGKEGFTESFYRMNRQIDKDIPFLLAIVKVQREALREIISNHTLNGVVATMYCQGCIDDFDVANTALNWQEDV